MRRPALAAILAVVVALPAQAQELVVYGAGSLREAVGQIATEFGRAHGIAIRTEFGPSGRMRARIEAGERVDVFTSADVGHARKLVEDGRAAVMAVFVRNTICVLSPPGFGVRTETLVERLAAPGVRLGMSPAGIDPLGDYTVRLLDRLDTQRPGLAAELRSHGVTIDLPPGSPPSKSGDADADAVLDGRIDASIVYCSGRDRYAKSLPGATLVAFPAQLQVGPEYALAVLKDAHPAAALLALTILSPAGQRVFGDRGFTPVTMPDR